MFALFRQPLRQLAGGRRLAGALQPEEDDHPWPLARRRGTALRFAKQRDHLVTDDLDDLLARRQTAEHVLPHRAVAHAIDERLDDLEVDVGLEERETDLAQRSLDVLGRQFRFAAKRFERILETRSQGFEHWTVGRRRRRPT
jgi:hypothetical protein